MLKRMSVMLTLVVLFIAAVGTYKFMQISAAIAAGKSFAPPPDAVTTTIATRAPWARTIDAVGAVAPMQGVTLSADLPGVVESVAFESGAHVKKGAPLVILDTRQERAQLASAEAAAELAKVSLTRSQSLLDQKLISQAEFDAASAQYKQAEAAANEIRATIARKTIYAPFAGIAGIRQVNPGQYVRSADPIVPLQSVGTLFANFSVPQQRLGELHEGQRVVVHAEGTLGRTFEGRISAINPVVDDATRNVQVQALLPNPTGALRPGMYVTVSVELGDKDAVVALPNSAINFAPYGSSVFIVESMKDPKGKSYQGVRQQFVKLGATRGDLVAITDGVKPGQEIVTSGVFKLRSGASVVVNNKVQPSSSSAPKPEDS